GLRIDHPDGLHDPAAYLLRVQARYRELAAAALGVPAEAVPPLYIVLEKITASHERLSEDWPVSGTTGYRFANVVNGLFVASAAKARLDRTWRAFVGAEADDGDATVVQSKLAIMRGPLAAELTLVANLALRIARGDRRTRDFTFNALRGAIEEVVARFPVYRTYVSARGASAQDRRYIEWALARARRESRTADPSVFDFIRALMLGSAGANATVERAAAYRAFAMRLQQFTAPVTAKGVEDTAYYRFNRLVSLNDVGGDPEQFGITVRAFHGASLDRAAVWPATMLATSTHDNKRSGDVRARIDVISEQAAEWRLAVRRWNRMNRGRKREVDGREAPSRNDEYLLYQTLIGTLPAGDMNVAMLAGYCARIEAYAVKAAREAKVHTSWLSVDSDYEEALVAFVRALLSPGERNVFLQDLRRQIVTYAWFGRLNSVSMALLKFASPGVPDLYQGTELLELRLVDPDNRGAVDYVERRARLAELEALSQATPDVRASAFAAWFANLDDGRAKLWVTYRLLQFRALHREMLAGRDYLPVTVTGAHADHVVAFARRGARQGAIAVAGRLFASLGALPGTLPLGEEVWGDTALDLQFVPAGAALTNVLTGDVLEPHDGHLSLARAFGVFPGAVLHYERPD
ncbi:MAG TPA: malto-oligosyltrehalose synthase, partial [Casimicrobiaceae bacterium]|nr:malto-oligosyltrehalose synthase [Casimicrobiaceae bacterium]